MPRSICILQRRRIRNVIAGHRSTEPYDSRHVFRGCAAVWRRWQEGQRWRYECGWSEDVMCIMDWGVRARTLTGFESVKRIRSWCESLRTRHTKLPLTEIRRWLNRWSAGRRDVSMYRLFVFGERSWVICSIVTSVAFMDFFGQASNNMINYGLGGEMKGSNYWRSTWVLRLHLCQARYAHKGENGHRSMLEETLEGSRIDLHIQLTSPQESESWYDGLSQLEVLFRRSGRYRNRRAGLK